jgi:hypothetical protein
MAGDETVMAGLSPAASAATGGRLRSAGSSSRETP